MPFNLLKTYNALLELLALNEGQRTQSLRGVFNRDIQENANFSFRGKKINPTKGEGDAMDILFKHLTTTKNEVTKVREFESARSQRLHWVKNHIEEKHPALLIFSVQEPDGVRTYIYDDQEKYVIVLEPYRNNLEYYLITAFYCDGRDPEKIKKKYNRRRLPQVV